MKKGMIYNICICLFMATVSFSTSAYAQENILAQKNNPAQLLPSEAFLLASTFSAPPSGITLGEGNLLFGSPGGGGGPPTEEDGGGIAGGEAPVGNGLWGMICATLVYALYSRRRTGKIIKSVTNNK